MFPDGLPPGHRRRIVCAAVACGVFVNAAVSFDPGSDRASAAVPHPVVVRLPGPVRALELVLAYAALLAVLGFATSRLVLRYRRGGEVVRQQVRWLMLGAATVPVLLAGGWIAQGLGAPTVVAYAGFLIAMLVAVPAAVAVAVLRYDLFDVDRLLGSSLAWLLTSLVSAAIFAGVVYGAAQFLGAGSRLGLTGAAFVTAVCLLPLHRVLSNAVGRLVDRERTVMVARVHEFVQRVRDGRAEPEGTEGLMRSVLGDPSLRLLIRLPGSPAGDYVDLTGNPASGAPDRTRIPLLTDGSEAGVILLGAASARRVRRAREVAVLARLPIEVSRLRLELRRALEDARSSRARLALSAAAERHRLARDLHDGAQQQIIAVGMRLRSVQRQLDPALPAHADLDAAVATLSATVAELRRLAHGVRPSRLDDDLATALKALVADSPVPVDITVDDIDTSEVIATTRTSESPKHSPTRSNTPRPPPSGQRDPARAHPDHRSTRQRPRRCPHRVRPDLGPGPHRIGQRNHVPAQPARRRDPAHGDDLTCASSSPTTPPCSGRTHPAANRSRPRGARRSRRHRPAGTPSQRTSPTSPSSTSGCRPP